MSTLEEKIRDALSDFWDERALPADFDGATCVEELVEPVESMTAVEVLVILDEIVGETIPNKVIQAGGYRTKEEFIRKLSERVVQFVREK
jgi:hypothetical protein